jgi:hypothetical protein
MLLAIVVFVAGTPFYIRNDNVKGKTNVIAQTTFCIFTALRNRMKKQNSNIEVHPGHKIHWLDYASNKYSAKVISDVKAFVRVLFVFLPLPIFWALYDQQGSRWTSQAQQLNGRVGNSFTIKPDQFQAVNPIFIVALVPIFDYGIYPFFAKFGLLKKQLQRMSIGLTFAIVSFCIAAFLESQMQQASSRLNPTDRIKLLNLSPCDLKLNFQHTKHSLSIGKQDSYSNMPNDILELMKENNGSLTFELTSNCKNGVRTINNLTLTTQSSPKAILFYGYPSTNDDSIKAYDFAYSIDPVTIGKSEIKISYFDGQNIPTLSHYLFNNIIKYDSKELTAEKLIITSDSTQSIQTSTVVNSNVSHSVLDYADYILQFKDTNGSVILSNHIILETGGRYTALVFRNIESGSIELIFLEDVKPNGIHLVWQLIQIFVMTVGEIMFSISGLSFAYSQAPATMKSVLQSLWLLTVAFGNLIVVVVAESRITDNQVYEYLFFAAMLTVATIVFIILSYFYKYVEQTDSESHSDDNTQITFTESQDMPMSTPEKPRSSPRAIINKAFDRSTEPEVKLIRMNSINGY